MARTRRKRPDTLTEREALARGKAADKRIESLPSRPMVYSAARKRNIDKDDGFLIFDEESGR